MKGFILGFALGAALGAAGAYLYMVGKRAEEIEQEEPEKPLRATKADSGRPVVLSKSESSKEDRVDYTKYSENKTSEKNIEPKKKEEPAQALPEDNVLEVIPPDEFGEDDSFDTMTFTYFRDGVLVDDAGDPLSTKDAAMLLGDDYLDHFGEYEDNSVYVKNYDHGAYYEVIKIDRDYSEYAKSKPRPVEIE